MGLCSSPFTCTIPTCEGARVFTHVRDQACVCVCPSVHTQACVISQGVWLCDAHSYKQTSLPGCQGRQIQQSRASNSFLYLLSISVSPLFLQVICFISPLFPLLSLSLFLLCLRDCVFFILPISPLPLCISSLFISYHGMLLSHFLLIISLVSLCAFVLVCSPSPYLCLSLY